MKQAIRRISILVFVLIFGANVFAQNLIEIADGRNFPDNKKPSKIETEFVKKEVKSKEQAIKNLAKSKDFKCDEDDAEESLANENVTANLSIYSILEGSFTKPKTSQKAYFYQVCWSDGGKYATALGGIIFAEKEKVVSHFAYANVSGFNNIRVLPDINRNGRSEISLKFTSWISGLLFSNSISLFEIDLNEIKYLGETTVYAQTDEGTSAYKISAKAGKTPVFYQEIYIDTLDDDDKTNWQIKEKSKQFALEKTKNGFDFVKL